MLAQSRGNDQLFSLIRCWQPAPCCVFCTYVGRALMRIDSDHQQLLCFLHSALYIDAR